MRLAEYGVLVGLALIWGASYALIKIGVAELAPSVLVAARVFLGFLTLAAAARLQGLAVPRDRRLWGRLAVLGIIGIVVPYNLITWGELHIPSDLAAVMQATTPLFTVLLAPLWNAGERLTSRNLGGVAIGLAGVAVLIGLPAAASRAADGLAGVGALAIAGSSLAYAITALYARRALRGVQPVIAALGQMGVASVAMIPLALATGPLPAHVPSFRVVAAIAFLGVVGTGIAYILYYWLIAHVGATRTTTVTYLIPPTALLWGALFLGEGVTMRMLLGLALILGGILLVAGRPRGEARGPAYAAASRGARGG